MNDEFSEKIQDIVSPILEQVNTDLVELRVKSQRNGYLIELYVDKPHGGITLEECADVNKRIVAMIETNVSMEFNYSLMVASPGIDWPLRTRKDFLRVVNRKVKFLVTDFNHKDKEHIGFVNKVNDKEVIIESNAQTLCIPFDDIKVAVQIV